ncbi:ABC transporter permease [Devosia sp.]|uniref:ABC transporter permease n=1 Tax=Devosia sp. TaxID=1871048 RepID=UPI001AC0F852|nr:ABC transporter permease [Devosia sp.]MBN9334276.1 ABC transporter permease [Devosia sp.]
MSTGFTTLELIVAAVLVLTSAGLSLMLKLGIHRSMLIAAARMVVQLLLLGLLLRSIFAMTNPWLTAGLVVFMVLAASYEVAARQERKLAGGWTFLVSGAAVSASTLFVSLFALGSVSLTQDWTAPQVVIPIAGIVLGTAMNAASVGLTALMDGLVSERDAIEAQLALGHSKRQAMQRLMQRAARTGTINVINQMAGAGIITLPGIMSGQVLAGQDPLVAAQSQIFLMFLLGAVSTASIVIAITLALTRLTDERHRLRLDHLQGELG